MIPADLTLTIQAVRPSDIEALLKLSLETFMTAFAHRNNADDVAIYTTITFNHDQLLAEIENPDTFFFFAMAGDEIAGYIKINYNTAQSEFQYNDAMEISRLYVSAPYQRREIGKKLANFAINKALADRLTYIWLGVWEQNHDAIRFYERNGFKQFGTHEFLLGNDRQTDILMRRELL